MPQQIELRISKNYLILTHPMYSSGHQACIVAFGKIFNILLSLERTEEISHFSKKTLVIDIHQNLTFLPRQCAPKVACD